MTPVGAGKTAADSLVRININMPADRSSEAG